MKTFESKLGNGYSVANPAIYLVAGYEELDPVFAGRLAYYAKCNGSRIIITEGYRSPERQLQLYNQYLEYKRTGKGSIRLAAAPGTSWHEYRLAIDTSSYPARGASNAELAKYGLCKPIKSEGWHIQPIETMNQSDRKKFAPKEVEDMTESEVKALLNNPPDKAPADWAKASWQWATANGLVDGSRPNARATRQELAKMFKAFYDLLCNANRLNNMLP